MNRDELINGMEEKRVLFGRPLKKSSHISTKKSE